MIVLRSIASIRTLHCHHNANLVTIKESFMICDIVFGYNIIFRARFISTVFPRRRRRRTRWSLRIYGLIFSILRSLCGTLRVYRTFMLVLMTRTTSRSSRSMCRTTSGSTSRSTSRSSMRASMRASMGVTMGSSVWLFLTNN